MHKKKPKLAFCCPRKKKSVGSVTIPDSEVQRMEDLKNNSSGKKAEIKNVSSVDLK
jgi:hypothetical protein